MKLFAPSRIINPFSVHKLGYGTGPSSGGVSVLTPPTVAPLLSVVAEFGSFTANLSWSFSNKVTSPGFGYKLEANINELGWTLAITTTSLSYDYVTDGTVLGTFAFRITPYNDAGDGPVSNEASVILPGESEAPALTGPGQSQVNETFNLSWNIIIGATEYRIERSTDNITFDLLATTTSLLYETFESALGSYYYRVIPFAGSIEGNHSNVCEVSITLPSNWLLISGFWNDAGEWDDTAFWPS